MQETYYMKQDGFVTINYAYKQDNAIMYADLIKVKVALDAGISVNPYDITEGGELQSSTGNLLLMDSTGTLTIPEGVTKIGEGAFANVEGFICK